MMTTILAAIGAIVVGHYLAKFCFWIDGVK